MLDSKTDASEFLNMFVLSHMDNKNFKHPFVLEFKDVRAIQIVLQALNDYADRLTDIKNSFIKNKEIYMSDLSLEKHTELSESSSDFLTWIVEDIHSIEDMDSLIANFIIEQI